MTIKYSKTISTYVYERERYAKRSMGKFFIFLSLILGISLIIPACRSKSSNPSSSPPASGGNPSNPSGGSLPPQQVAITSTTPGTDSIAVTWALDTRSTGEAVGGVVAVLQEAALTPGNACGNVPANVATHARNGSGSGSGTSGSTIYLSDNDVDGSTLTFDGLTAGATYSLAVCSVSAAKMRGDGTGGAANQAVVRSVTTNSASRLPPGSPPRQIEISSTTRSTDSIAVTWVLETGSTGEAVQGVVAVLQEAALTPGNACENVPANIATHARNGSGSGSGTSGSTTYLSDNDADGSTLTFGSLTAGTTYSLAVCSVSAAKIRGDGTGGAANHAVVRIITTNSASRPPPASPPRQVTISSTTRSTDSIAVTWVLETGSTGEAVRGVVAVLQEAALTPGNACENVPANVLTHARDGSGSGSGTSGSTTYLSDNDADGSTLMFSSLMASTTYSLAFCSVSTAKMRGDGTGGAANHAVVTSVTTASTGPPPAAGSPPQQVMITSTTPGTNSMAVTWALDTGSTGEAVVGVVAVLQETALTDVGACENVPANVLTHARDGSGSGSGTSGSTTYLSDNDADGSTLTFGSLTAGTSYSIALCSVSAAKIRGDGNADRDDGHAIITSVTTTSPPPPSDPPPQQIAIYATFSGTDRVGFRWALDRGSTDSGTVLGVVAVLQETALSDTNACENVPANVLTNARDGSGSDSGTSGGTMYKADHNTFIRSTGGNVLFRGLTAGTTYFLAVCSVSATKIRGDGNADGDDVHAIVRSITTTGTGPPPAGSPPQQVTISSTTLGTNTMTFTWALDPGSTGEAVVGVVAVLQEAALTDVSACAAVPANVLAHARDGSGEIWRRSGNTQYRADNDADGSTVPLWILTAGTTYSLALCSVSAAKIRGDGNSDGDNGHAVVQSVTTTSPAPDSPPQQIRLFNTRSYTNKAGFRWALEAGSTGGAVVGVVAVLQETALSDVGACENVPENVLAYARDRSGSDSGTSGDTMYKADHNISRASPGGAVVFTDLTAGTTYSLAVCAVSATKIRGDGNSDGDDAHAIVQSIMTIGTRPPLPTFPKQVAVPAPTSTPGSNSITVSWSIDTDSTGRTVLGVVAVLKEQSGASASLDESSACSEVSDAIVAHARGGSGSGSETSDDTTYRASNSASGNLTFTDLMAMTDYSIAVCSVAYDGESTTSYIRGDGNADGDDAHAVVHSGVRITAGPVMPTEVSVKQIDFSVSPNPLRADSILLVWSVDAMADTSHEPVVGVVIALKEKPDTSASLDPSDACVTSSTGLTASIINHARSLGGTNNGMGSDGTQYRASNLVGVTDRNLTITGLMSGTNYSVVVCSVSADNIRGDGSSTLVDDDAVLGQVTTNPTPPKQVMFSSTSGKKTITISWELDSSADTSHKDITGVVGVLSTANISTRNACEVALSNGVVRYASGDDTGIATFQEASAIHTTIYVASRGAGATSTSFMFTGLTPDTAYSVTVCSVLSVTNHRGDGRRDRNAVAVQSVTTLPPMPPKQIQFASMTPTATSTTITVGWAVSDTASESHEAVVGVVAVLKEAAALGPNSACAAVPAGDPLDTSVPDVLSYARDGMTGSASGTSGGIRYMAQYDEASDDMGSLTITGLTPGKMYYVAVCSVSEDNIRGDNEGTTDQAITSSAIATPGIVMLYKSQSVLGDANDHANGGAQLSEAPVVGTNICRREHSVLLATDYGWGVPLALEADDGYSRHTFYGSTNSAATGTYAADATDGHFKDLPTRLAVTDQTKREVWVYYIPKDETTSGISPRSIPGSATEFTEERHNANAVIHKPSTPVTLAELIAIDANGKYVNKEKVQSVFRLLQNGDETTATSNFEHWSFTRADGTFDARVNALVGDGTTIIYSCTSADGVPGTTQAAAMRVQNGIFGAHNGDDDPFIGGVSSTEKCTLRASDASDARVEGKTVLCIAKKDSGF